MDLSPDTLLNNRYRISHLLGQGGMGAVYLAHDLSLETQVAVKTNRNPSKESSTQFIREARLLASLRHPNLPRVIDYFLMGDMQFLVMDYIPGDDLGTVLKQEGIQPIDRVLKWAEQLSSALTYLHNQKPPVIHRDIKPGNLKLMPTGEIILVDFGIAKAADTSQATATGAMGYTPGFAPPEQYGHGRTGPFSDQYAMAATLYTLLTNQRPADSVQRLLNQDTLIPIRTFNPSVPAHVEAAIYRAMSVRPEDRFVNVAEFMEALRNPAFTPTVTRVGPPQPPISQMETQAVPSPAYAPTGPYVQPVGSTPNYASIPSSPPSYAPIPSTPPAYTAIPSIPPQTPAKGRSWIWIGIGIALAGVVVLAIAVAGIYLLSSNNGLAFLSATNTPANLAMQPPTVTEQLTETPRPTQTPQPTETSVPPTETPPPQATPTEAPKPIAGDKVIAFVSDRADGKTLQVWTMHVGLDNAGKVIAGNFKQITFDEGDKRQPAWAPDGRKLLYVAPASGTGLDIFLLDLTKEGSQPVNLTKQKGDDTDPAWSPDGKYIVFTNRGKFVDIRMLYIMDANGSNITRLSLDFEEYHPTWSPKSDWILNVIHARDHRYLFMHSWIGNIYPTPFPTPQQFDRSTYFGRLGEVDDPAWSPDGTHIAYTRLDRVRKQIYTVEFKSGGAKTNLLTSEVEDNFYPTWSPDSQWIAFTSLRDDNEEVYVMTATGLLQSNLTSHPGRDMDPAWQP